MGLFGDLFGSKEEKPQVRKYKVGERVRHKKIAEVVKKAVNQNEMEVEKLRRSRKL